MSNSSVKSNRTRQNGWRSGCTLPPAGGATLGESLNLLGLQTSMAAVEVTCFTGFYDEQQMKQGVWNYLTVLIQVCMCVCVVSLTTRQSTQSHHPKTSCACPPLTWPGPRRSVKQDEVNPLSTRFPPSQGAGVLPPLKHQRASHSLHRRLHGSQPHQPGGTGLFHFCDMTNWAERLPLPWPGHRLPAVTPLLAQ